MQYCKLTIKMALCLLILFTACGCEGIQRSVASAELSIRVQPVVSRYINRHAVNCIEVGQFIDKRPDTPKDQVGYYHMALSYHCSILDFEKVVADAFRDTLKAKDTDTQTNCADNFILTGEIEEFTMVYDSAIAINSSVGYDPLVIKVSLKNSSKQLLWQKTLEGKVGDLYLHAHLSLLPSDFMRGTAKQCIRDAIKKLVEDPSFWQAIETNHQQTTAMLK